MNGLKNIDNFEASSWENKIPKGSLILRDEAITALCKGKTVLHIGAADVPFHEVKAKKGELLHQKVSLVATEIVGLDINAEAVELLKKFDIDDILVADIISEFPLSNRTFDIVLCCDVVEHVNEPGRLLAAASRYMNDQSIIVVSTINATALKPSFRAFFGREAVHPDHICYFSFSTLCQLLVRQNFNPKYFGAFSYPLVHKSADFIVNTIFRRSPGLADGIMIIAGKDL